MSGTELHKILSIGGLVTSVGVAGATLVVGLFLLGAEPDPLILGLVALAQGGVWLGFMALRSRRFIIGEIAYLVGAAALVPFGGGFVFWIAPAGAIALISLLSWVGSRRASRPNPGAGK